MSGRVKECENTRVKIVSGTGCVDVDYKERVVSTVWMWVW